MEHDIVIRWNWADQSAPLDSIHFRLNCGLDDTFIDIDIQSNEYRCQSLVSGRLYIITMVLDYMDKTIQRSRSIQANTCQLKINHRFFCHLCIVLFLVLQKCRYLSHFYPPESNDISSVIIEWAPPEPDFDEIHVHCPLSTITFQRSQLMPNMFVKCVVSTGIPFTVTFVTSKSGYESQSLSLSMNALIFEQNRKWSSLLFFSDDAITNSTTTIISITASTRTIIPAITTTTRTTLAGATTGEQILPVVCSNCSLNELNQTKRELTQWRIAAIVSIIIGGFFLFGTICLTGLAVLLHSRNHHNKTDE